MWLTRWNPFEELDALTRSWSVDGFANETFRPTVDVSETNDAILVRADLPGVDPERIELRVENGVLTLRAERRIERADKDERALRFERRSGWFARSFSLPAEVDETQIDADYEAGVLTVRLPKRSEVRPRSIKVKARK